MLKPPRARSLVLTSVLFIVDPLTAVPTMNSTDVSTRNRSWSVFSICSHRHLDHAVFAGSLGLVHRVVRFAQQFVAPRLGARDGDDADAGGDGGRPPEHRTDPAREAIGEPGGH